MFFDPKMYLKMISWLYLEKHVLQQKTSKSVRTDVLIEIKRFIYQTPDGAGWRLNGCRAEMDGLVTGVMREAATSQHNLFIPRLSEKIWEFPFFPRRVHVTDK